MATICIDAGTTVIKSVAFSDTGNELAISARRTTVLSPQAEWAEQDMLDVWAAVVETVTEVVSKIVEPVTAISVTAQGDGAWLIDSHGQPVRTAILWSDGRSAEVMEALRREGRLEKAWDTNGSLSSLGLPNAILRWLAKNEPANLSRSHALLSCGSWIVFKLTSTIGQHLSDASAPWVDVRTGHISRELIELYELSDWEHLIPPVFSAEPSPLEPQAAEQVGVPAGIPVVMAPYDIVATAAGSGAVRPGDAFAILGTTICPGVISSTAHLDGVRTGLNLVGAGDGLLLRAFPTITGANSLSWLGGLTGIDDGPAVAKLAKQSPPGARGIIWLPYLSPAGERAPFFNPDASGSLFGLYDHHTQADLARALIESLSYVIREALDAAGTTATQLSLAGGAAQSDLWAQTIADVTGLETIRSHDTQVGAKGALIYALVATGKYESVAQAADNLVHKGSQFTPQDQNRELHGSRFELFRSLREAVAPLWSTHRGADNDI